LLPPDAAGFLSSQPATTAARIATPRNFAIFISSSSLVKTGRTSTPSRTGPKELVLARFILDQPHGVLAAEPPEQSGMDQELAEGRGHESAQDYRRDGVENLQPRFP